MPDASASPAGPALDEGVVATGLGEAQQEEPTDGEAAADDAACTAELLASMQLTDADVQRFLKINQRCPDNTAHPDWLAARRGRVTASRFASACGVRGAKLTPAEVVTQMFTQPEANPGQANCFGVRFEDAARNAYVSARRRQGQKEDPSYCFEVREVGVCVCKEHPWMAASPDGICWERGEPAGLLEVKTGRTWGADMDAKLTGQLPPDWLYQMHGGMRLASAATGFSMPWCDLFLWTPGRSNWRRIPFDHEFWQTRMFPMLRSFYFEQYLPAAAELAQRAKAKRPAQRSQAQRKGPRTNKHAEKRARKKARAKQG